MLDARLWLFVALGILAACTTQPAKKVTAAANDVQCHTEQTTGSMIVRTVCLTKAQRDARQAGIDDLQDTLIRQGGSNPTPYSRPVNIQAAGQ